jgi:hypothetical protein
MLLVALAATTCLASHEPEEPTIVTVVHREVIRRDANAAMPSSEEPDGFTWFAGQIIRREVELPARPATPAATPRIIAEVAVRPKYTLQPGGRLRPNDPWNRLGTVTVQDRRGGRLKHVELMRFITSYGGPSTFRQDVTTLAPVLHGQRTFDVYISTFTTEPAWEVTFRLIYDPDDGAGYRRPVFVNQVLHDRKVDARRNDTKATLSGVVTIPAGVARPRLRILTTGHASDGKGKNEFVTSTHILRIDDAEVARWRPWTERGSMLRNPGRIVEPLMIPTPELEPGRHEIELEIDGIRPSDSRESPHGYWVVTVQVVADERLPSAEPTQDSTRD